MCCSVKSCEACEDSSVSSAGLETLGASYPHSGHSGGIVQILQYEGPCREYRGPSQPQLLT